jgi:anti-sigma regulatory factor (Ser/Thr protein kinase)
MAKTSISGDVASYNKAVEFIIAHTARTGLDTKIVTKAKLFCQEIILNIIKHAYDARPGDIGIECAVENDEYAIVITDSGAPYNSLAQRKTTGKSTKKAVSAVSDFGKLIGDVFDSADYKRTGSHNVVTLRKNLGPGKAR